LNLKLREVVPTDEEFQSRETRKLLREYGGDELTEVRRGRNGGEPEYEVGEEREYEGDELTEVRRCRNDGEREYEVGEETDCAGTDCRQTCQQ
jgi:hypothetical protein